MRNNLTQCAGRYGSSGNAIARIQIEMWPGRSGCRKDLMNGFISGLEMYSIASWYWYLLHSFLNLNWVRYENSF